MSEINLELVENVKDWVSYAEEDLVFARHGLMIEPKCPNRLVAYHAQQCVEKYIKGYLILHSIEFTYSHNIRYLLKLCNSQELSEKLRDAKKLSHYAVLTKYPGFKDNVSKESAIRAIEIAITVRDVIREAITQEGVTLPE